ncbi:MAG: hypothetical protein JWM07_647, partial [Candidatus Saccharibacteria bacterium]|nr:hypothetical protein [Candidatus Saccharibacteria bacterium]
KLVNQSYVQQKNNQFTLSSKKTSTEVFFDDDEYHF